MNFPVFLWFLCFYFGFEMINILLCYFKTLFVCENIIRKFECDFANNKYTHFYSNFCVTDYIFVMISL